MRSHIKAGMAASLAMALTIPGSARAQSTALTYQGRLKNGAAPATGLHDFRFTLFNVSSGGVQLAPPVCADNVSLAEGFFTATIDFGQQFVTTESRFLQIEVRADTGLSCANPAGLIVLGPRQPLTAAPIASHARSAFSLAAADGSPANAVSVDNDGKVGVGTTTPSHTVHIAAIAPTLALQDTDSTTQQVGYVDYRDSGNVSQAWVGFGSAGDPDFSVVNARPGGDIVLLRLGGGNVGIGTASPSAALHVAGSGIFDGLVGIGTSSPLARLDVRGDIRLGPSGQFSATSGEENLRIIRGRVSAAGGLSGGSGFSVVRTATGRYAVTFTQPFQGIPTVTATTTWDINLSDNIAIEQISSGTVSFAVNNPVVGGSVDTPFHFIAIGQR